MNTRPTPETDDATLIANDIEHGGNFNAVHVQVSKRLERERDEWKALATQYSTTMITPKTKGADAIIDAWLIEGVHPPTHRKLKEQLRREWPMLAKAIERLVNAEDSPENASANENREWALKAEKERDEAREQLAGIEDKMRVELGGHPNSKLWGEAGLIAATMRCVDALGEVTDQRDRLAAALREITLIGDTMSDQIANEALQSLTPNEP